jgi:hypothetical protein
MEIGNMSDTMSLRSTLTSEIKLMAVAYPAAIVLGLSLLAFQGLSGVQIFTFTDKATTKSEPAPPPAAPVAPVLPLEPINNLEPVNQTMASANAQNSAEQVRKELIEMNRALEAQIAELHRTVADLTTKTVSLQKQYTELAIAQVTVQSQKNGQFVWEFDKSLGDKSWETALYGWPVTKEFTYKDIAGISPTFECKFDFPKQLLKCSDPKEFILNLGDQSTDKWMKYQTGLPAKVKGQ